jgi:uncharacterized iron-regulated membrane protein
MAGVVWRRVDRWLTWFHRWAGVVLSALVLLWFLSGAVLHFVGFPKLTSEDRLAHEEPISQDRVLVAPAAIEGVANADGLRLISVAGRPVYIESRSGGLPVAVAADTGKVLPLFPASTAWDIAGRFGHAPVQAVSRPIEYDQWVVPQDFDPWRPMYRVRLGDAMGTELYVSARTGEVVQATTSRQRAWNWCGAIVHWIYLTPLRKSPSRWDITVWWISLAALISAVVGFWLGMVRLAANKAARRPGLSPFRRWMRWHHVLGIFGSVVVLGWLLSGWLSMDEGRIFPEPYPTQQESDGMRGIGFADVIRTVTLNDLHAVGPAAQVSFDAVGGRSFMDIQPPRGARPFIRWLGSGPETSSGSLSDAALSAGLGAIWPGRVGGQLVNDSLDDFYRHAEGLPDSAVGFRLLGPGATRVYVDRYSGQLLAIAGPRRRAYDWVYYALHTLKFPGLLDHPDIRTLIELMLLALGVAFSSTGVILSVKRVKRSF